MNFWLFLLLRSFTGPLERTDNHLKEFLFVKIIIVVVVAAILAQN